MSSLPESLKLLQHCEGSRFAGWLGGVLGHDPELQKAFEVLAQLVTATDTKLHKKVISSYIGHVKCPSVSRCSKLAYRTEILHGWVSDGQLPWQLRVQGGLFALERLLPACEGADDKHGILRQSVRKLVNAWLVLVSESEVEPAARSQYLYQGMILDQCSLIEPVWWWKAMVAGDLTVVLQLAEQSIESLPAIEPSRDIRWKSYSQRWVRLRLKGFLEFIGHQRLLAELLKRSAIDDFEAAAAIETMIAGGQSREALSFGERWLRAMPHSPVIAEAMIKLYRADGWDDEACALAKEQHDRDPHPRWLAYLPQSSSNRSF